MPIGGSDTDKDAGRRFRPKVVRTIRTGIDPYRQYMAATVAQDFDVGQQQFTILSGNVIAAVAQVGANYP